MHIFVKLTFSQVFICNMISEWTSQLDRLNTVAETQPHFAYAALTHGVLSKNTSLELPLMSVNS
jgi:hypothetical protein